MSKITRRGFGKAALAAPFVASLGTVRISRAASFPSRPITIIAPYGAGGNADTVARIMADALSPLLGVSVVVENHPGANGMIGAAMVEGAEPDGHTLLQGAWSSQVILPIIAPHMAKDPLETLVMVSPVMSYAIVFGVPVAGGITSLDELTAKIKDPAYHATWVSFGPATPSDIMATLYLKAIDGTAAPVSYRGIGQAWVDAQAGRLTFLPDSLGSVMTQEQNGVGRLIATSTIERLPSAPDVPTMAEAVPGYPEVALNPWGALFAPRGTDPEILALLNKAVRDALHQEAVKTRIEGFRQDVVAGNDVEAANQAWKDEIAQMRPIMDGLGITIPAQ